MRRKLTTIMLIVTMLLAPVTCSAATWHKSSNGWWLRKDNGSYARGWEKSNGRWYHFSNRGYMSTGWKKINNKWYYFRNNGYMSTGWKKINNKWYCFRSNGSMITNGWKKSGRNWYYFDKNGKLQTGIRRINGKIYTFSSSGALTGTTTGVPSILRNNRVYNVYGGNLSGKRYANAKVDIGFGNRKYWAYTNAYGQLVYVTADRIVLQNEYTEPVNENGRYYNDQAAVPGTESYQYDKGHVIADSLGGVGNAYNITPQDKNLNRHGDQAYMEKVIRDAGGATDFSAVITYPNKYTQIPNHYSFEYTIRGHKVNDEFDNTDPEGNTSGGSGTTAGDRGKIKIIHLDKAKEHIILKNIDSKTIDLKGWTIVSELGNQKYTFKTSHKLKPGACVIVGDSKKVKVNYHWMEGRGVWNNSKSDPARLENSYRETVSRWND